MEITRPPELLVYPLVARELTPDATVIEVRGRRIGDGVMIEVHAQPEDALCDGPQQIRIGEFARFADEVRTLVALMGKTVG
jgi:3-deoxy-D-manno-octulosonic acid (KDO) 8-phosphate synthase